MSSAASAPWAASPRSTVAPRATGAAATFRPLFRSPAGRDASGRVRRLVGVSPSPSHDSLGDGFSSTPLAAVAPTTTEEVLASPSPPPGGGGFDDGGDGGDNGWGSSDDDYREVDLIIGSLVEALASTERIPQGDAAIRVAKRSTRILDSAIKDDRKKVMPSALRIAALCAGAWLLLRAIDKRTIGGAA
jgi:hypothetical protein